MTSLSKQHIATIKDAAKKSSGANRRAFQAQGVIDYLNSSSRTLAEKTVGWDRKTVALGLNELRQGSFVDNIKARGNKKTEEQMPQLEADIISLAEPESQIDPKLRDKLNSSIA